MNLTLLSFFVNDICGYNTLINIPNIDVIPPIILFIKSQYATEGISTNIPNKTALVRSLTTVDNLEQKKSRSFIPVPGFLQ